VLAPVGTTESDPESTVQTLTISRYNQVNMAKRNTSTNEIPVPRSLPNKPLIEAIFELRWKLRDSPSLLRNDPGFRIALGRYYDQVRHEYPHVVDLPTSQVPEHMTAHSVRHQFRVAKDKWPVTQLGPGILTVNETTGYTWDTFLPRLLSAIKAVFQAYPTDIAPFEPAGVQLRYLDAIELDQNNDIIRFLREHLHTDVVVEPLLFEGPHNPGKPSRLTLNFTLPLQDPPGAGILGFATASRDNKPIILMETTIRSDDADVPGQEHEFERWLNSAHDVAGNWFFTLIRGNLLSNFERVNGNADA